MQQTKSFQSRSRDFLKKQGFYIVLFVCLLIVGAAVALTMIPKANVGEENQDVAAQPAVESNVSSDERFTLIHTPLPTATPQASATPTPLPTATPKSVVKAVKKAAAPVDGEIVWGYAVDQLLYSKTLDQWTTHAGVDIAADAGTPVKAVLAGTVKSVTMDDSLGRVVLVEHTNNRKSVYANLEEAVTVTEGQKVNAGDTIGKVGKTAVSECGAVSHLHFAFLVSDKPADPMEHIQLAH